MFTGLILSSKLLVLLIAIKLFRVVTTAESIK